MFGYFEGQVQAGGNAFISWWEVTVALLDGAVVPTSGAAAIKYSFDPTAASLDWDAISAATVNGTYWGAGASTLAGTFADWDARGGARNTTLEATANITCMYNAPNLLGNNAALPDSQYYWTPFWETSAPTAYRDGAGNTRTFCSDAHSQPDTLIFTSSAQSNYGAVLGSYTKRNVEGVDCGDGSQQAVGCPTVGFDALEIGYLGGGAIPFAGAVSYGLVGTGQALTGPFAGRPIGGGSFSFLAIESVRTDMVGVSNPNMTSLVLKGFKCLLAGVSEGGDAYRFSCAPEVFATRSRGSITACLQPYAMTPFTNTLCIQNNPRGRPLGYPLPSTWAAAGGLAAAAAGTAQGGGYLPNVGGSGGAGRRRTRRRVLAADDAAAA